MVYCVAFVQCLCGRDQRQLSGAMFDDIGTVSRQFFGGSGGRVGKMIQAAAIKGAALAAAII